MSPETANWLLALFTFPLLILCPLAVVKARRDFYELRQLRAYIDPFVPCQARVLELEFVDRVPMSMRALYQYDYNGKSYSGHIASINEVPGMWNSRNFPEGLTNYEPEDYERMKHALKTDSTFEIWVNPRNSGDSVPNSDKALCRLLMLAGGFFHSFNC